jgi:hypothetical protein
MKENASSDFSEYTLPIITDLLAVLYFLENNEVPPEEPDLLLYIHKNYGDIAFINFLIRNIHRLINSESFGDELKTLIKMHIEKTSRNKS